MPKPKYDLPPEEALAWLQAELAQMQADPNREQLTDITPDDAFERGYEAAMFDFKRVTGPDPTTQENS